MWPEHGVGDGAGSPFHEGALSWCSEGNLLALVGAQGSCLRTGMCRGVGEGGLQRDGGPGGPPPGTLGGTFPGAQRRLHAQCFNTWHSLGMRGPHQGRGQRQGFEGSGSHVAVCCSLWPGEGTAPRALCFRVVRCLQPCAPHPARAGWLPCCPRPGQAPVSFHQPLARGLPSVLRTTGVGAPLWPSSASFQIAPRHPHLTTAELAHLLADLGGKSEGGPRAPPCLP